MHALICCVAVANPVPVAVPRRAVDAATAAILLLLGVASPSRACTTEYDGVTYYRTLLFGKLSPDTDCPDHAD